MRFYFSIQSKFLKMIFLNVITCFTFIGVCSADEESIKKEIASLKARITQLEEKLAQEEARISQQQQKTEEIERIREVFEGFTIGGGATFVLQGTHNANNTSRKNEDVIDTSYSLDLEFGRKFEEINGRAFMHLETGQGAAVEDEITVFSNVNKDANTDTNLRVAEIFYEQELFDKRMALIFGKLDPTVYLDENVYANDETSQFLGRLFRNSPVIEFPDNSAGFCLNLTPLESFNIQLSILDADADWEDVFDCVFSGGEITLRPRFFDREGNYRLLGWVNTRAHTKWLAPTVEKEKTYGLGISFDQGLTENLACFLRYGWQDPKVYLTGSSFSLEQAYSAGLWAKGSLWSREDDILGLALGWAIPSDDYKEAVACKARDEGHFEAYYNIHMNKYLHLSPDLQIIWNPYGDDVVDKKDTITVFGLRGQVDF